MLWPSRSPCDCDWSARAVTGQSFGPRRWTRRTSPRKTRRSTVAANRLASNGAFRPRSQGLGAERNQVTGEPAGRTPASDRLPTQPAQRGPHDEVSPRVGRLDLPLNQVDRAEEAGHEGVDRPVVHGSRTARLNDPAEVHHRQVVSHREGLASVRSQDQGRCFDLGHDPTDLVKELLSRTRASRRPKWVIKNQEVRAQAPGLSPAATRRSLQARAARPGQRLPARVSSLAELRALGHLAVFSAHGATPRAILSG